MWRALFTCREFPCKRKIEHYRGSSTSSVSCGNSLLHTVGRRKVRGWCMELKKDWRAMQGCSWWVHKWVDHQPRFSGILEEINDSTGSLKLKWYVCWASPFNQDRFLGFPYLHIPSMEVQVENLKLSRLVEGGWIAVNRQIKCHSNLHSEQLLFAPGLSWNSWPCLS